MPPIEDISARVEGEPEPAPIPACALADLTSSVRPPRPGSAPPSGAMAPVRPTEESRRDRKSTGEYSIFELLSLTDYQYAGTCLLEARPVHVVTFAPPRAFDPQNPVERVAMAMKGTILVDAAEYQVVRAEGRTVAPIKWGAGLVALRSAHVVFENAKVRNEVWLPSFDLFDFDARVIFDDDHQRITHVYDDYQKLEITTSEEFTGPAG